MWRTILNPSRSEGVMLRLLLYSWCRSRLVVRSGGIICMQRNVSTPTIPSNFRYSSIEKTCEVQNHLQYTPLGQLQLITGLAHFSPCQCSSYDHGQNPVTYCFIYTTLCCFGLCSHLKLYFHLSCEKKKKSERRIKSTGYVFEFMLQPHPKFYKQN